MANKETLKAAPKREYIGGALDFVGRNTRKLGEAMNPSSELAQDFGAGSGQAIPWGDLLGLTGAGSFMEDMSYQGSTPFKGGSLQTGSADPRILDLLGLAPIPISAAAQGARGAKYVGKEGLRMMHNGMAFGQGPLSGLSHLSPGVMKREGGNWFPDEIEKQVKKMQGLTTTSELQDWIAGPMKNYIQKRFASPNDEIRKLYEEGINVLPEAPLAPFGAEANWQNTVKFADPAIRDGSRTYSRTPLGMSWDMRADSMVTPDAQLLNAAKASFPMPQYLKDFTPEERIGAETIRFLKRRDAQHLVPPEIIGADTNRARGASQEASGRVAEYMKNNRDILQKLTTPPAATKKPTRADWVARHEAAAKFGYSSPEVKAIQDQLNSYGSGTITKRMGKALDETYDHLDKAPGTPYKGRGFKWDNNLRFNPFAGIDTNLGVIRDDFGKGAAWIKNVPEDNPINSFESIVRNYPRGSRDLSTMPEFGHMIDVMNEDMYAGRLTPQQLKSGSYSVDAAARRAHEYNVAKEAAMSKNKLIEAAGFPTLKEYDSGHKWLELKHSKDNALTAKALKDEGNAMGHCVGGYCNSVLGGDTRIVSLRDAKGQPRTTIELRRSAMPFGRSLRPELQQQVRKETGMPEWSIHQIKGPANRKPSKAEIPMIQDFIMNQGPWHGDIGDFHNSDLANLKEAAKFNSWDRYTNSGIGETETGLIKPRLEATPDEDMKILDFNNWANDLAEQQGHPYISKDELTRKFNEITGLDGPAY